MKKSCHPSMWENYFGIGVRRYVLSTKRDLGIVSKKALLSPAYYFICSIPGLILFN